MQGFRWRSGKLTESSRRACGELGSPHAAQNATPDKFSRMSRGELAESSRPSRRGHPVFCNVFGGEVAESSWIARRRGPAAPRRTLRFTMFWCEHTLSPFRLPSATKLSSSRCATYRMRLNFRPRDVRHIGCDDTFVLAMCDLRSAGAACRVRLNYRPRDSCHAECG